MDHVFDHQLVKLRLCLWIREFCRNERVDVLWSMKLGIMMQEDVEMHVWETSLLKLNGVDMCNGNTQSALFYNLENGIDLCLEDTCNQVRSICSGLTLKQFCLNLWPTGIGSDSHKEIGTLVVTIDSQGILTVLDHIARASRVAGRQNSS